MDWTVIVAAAITALFAFFGTWLSTRKQTTIWEYRLKQLEGKLDRHNGFEARIVALETEMRALRSR